MVKKEGKTRVRKTKVQKKTMSLNGRSFGSLLRKLLVVLKGISEACEIHMRELAVGELLVDMCLIIIRGV